MISLFQPIIDRIIDQVPDFNTVAGPYILAALPNNSIGPLLPAAIVVPGSGQHQPQNTLSMPGQESQDWSVVIVMPYQNTEANDTLVEAQADVLMRAVYTALHKWTADKTKQRREFRYKGREAPSYSSGYAEFPLSFSVDAII